MYNSFVWAREGWCAKAGIRTRDRWLVSTSTQLSSTSAQSSWLVERPAWAWNSLEEPHLSRGRKKQRSGAQVRSLIAGLAWDPTCLRLGGQNAIPTIRAPYWNDYYMWQFHRGLKAAKSFRATPALQSQPLGMKIMSLSSSSGIIGAWSVFRDC